LFTEANLRIWQFSSKRVNKRCNVAGKLSLFAALRVCCICIFTWENNSCWVRRKTNAKKGQERWRERLEDV